MQSVGMTMKGPDATDCVSGVHEQRNAGKAEDEARQDKCTKCPLCDEMFGEPKMLPCLHTFCLRCLEQFKAQLTTSSSKVTCPRCRQESPVPVGGLGSLPANVFFARLTQRRRTLSSVNGVDDGAREVISSLDLSVMTCSDVTASRQQRAKAPFPSKRNRLRCVRCVWMETGLNASPCVGKQPVMVATASTEHPATSRSRSTVFFKSSSCSAHPIFGPAPLHFTLPLLSHARILCH